MAKVLEKHFQRQVVELAQLYGWLAYHVPDSRRVTCRGCPDTILLHRVKHRLAFAELKVGNNTTTPEQDEWLCLLATIPGVEVYVWRPGDIDSIVTTLQSC